MCFYQAPCSIQSWKLALSVSTKPVKMYKLGRLFLQFFICRFILFLTRFLRVLEIKLIFYLVPHHQYLAELCLKQFYERMSDDPRLFSPSPGTDLLVILANTFRKIYLLSWISHILSKPTRSIRILEDFVNIWLTSYLAFLIKS